MARSAFQQYYHLRELTPRGDSLSFSMNVFRQTLSAALQQSWPEGLPLGFARRLGVSAAFRSRARIIDRAGVRFIDRSRGNSHLLVVLSGYKPALWPLTMPRLVRFVPSDVDVCIVSSGRHVEALATAAEQHGWSYLSTELNELSVVQNAAIERHPRAQFIYKLDEDMFIGENFFELMMEGHLRIKAEEKFFLGFSAPLINLNGYSYLPMLQALGRAESYRALFGPLRQAAESIPVLHTGAAARWLWQEILPFDEAVRFFAQQQPVYTACPHRFSIGAMLFEREFWQAMGGWAVNLVPGGMGYDEVGVCNYCMANSRIIGVLHNVLVGHFAFGPQFNDMMAILPEITEGLKLSVPALTEVKPLSWPIDDPLDVASGPAR